MLCGIMVLDGISGLVRKAQEYRGNVRGRLTLRHDYPAGAYNMERWPSG